MQPRPNPLPSRAGQTLTGKDFQADTGAIISGTVYKSDGITPITGEKTLSVYLYEGNPCGNLTHVAAGTINTSDGTYELTGFPAGTYYMRLVHNSTIYMDEWWAEPASTRDCSLAQSVTVTAGQTLTGMDFQADTGAIISGTVYKSDGITPIAGKTLSVYLYEGDPCGNLVSVSAVPINTSDGTYWLSGFPAGTYYFSYRE